MCEILIMGDMKTRNGADQHLISLLSSWPSDQVKCIHFFHVMDSLDLLKKLDLLGIDNVL